MYEGDYFDGIRSGNGKYTYKNGSYYEGPFIENQYHGEGIFADEAGNKNRLLFSYGEAKQNLDQTKGRKKKK